MNKLLIYTIFTIGFLIAFIKINIYFIYKSKEAFKNLKESYISLKKAKEDLLNEL
jgi:cbb3-type cytochrome oxidase subunit 3